MHEPEAIEGMINIIKRDEPTIIIEVLNEIIAERLSYLLADINYVIYFFDEINSPVMINSLKKSNFYNILLIKKEKSLMLFS